jgi:hypothetical protein
MVLVHYSGQVNVQCIPVNSELALHVICAVQPSLDQRLRCVIGCHRLTYYGSTRFCACRPSLSYKLGVAASEDSIALTAHAPLLRVLFACIHAHAASHSHLGILDAYPHTAPQLRVPLNISDGWQIADGSILAQTGS